MTELSPAAQAAADLVAGAARIAEAPEGEQTAPETEAVPEAPSFEADLSGIEDLLDVPEDIVEEEPLDDQEPEDFDEYDPNQLQAKVKKLEKQNKWLEEQRVTQGRKNWASEAERRFPLADVGEIKATSRRAFLRAAAESHTRYEKKLKPILTQLDALKGSAVDAVRQEERQQEARSWGSPSGGPNQPHVERVEAEAQLDRRNYRGVKEMVKARMKNDPRYKDGI